MSSCSILHKNSTSLRFIPIVSSKLLWRYSALSEKKPDHQIISPVLEAPPTPDLPAKEMSALLEGESLPIVLSKLMISESMLHLVNRDYKFHDFMREVLVSIMKVIKSEAGSILEIDQENNVLFFRSVVGCSSDRVTRFVISMGQGLVGHVAESRQPLLVDEINENNIYLKSIEKAVGFQARNVIAVPILIRGKVFGVIELLNRVGEETYTSQDLELLTYASNASAKAIESRLILGWSLQNRSKLKEAA